MKTMEMKVTKIEDEGDRFLFFGDDPKYFVICGTSKAFSVKVSDTIIYEPYGVNFGWFISKVEQEMKTVFENLDEVQKRKAIVNEALVLLDIKKMQLGHCGYISHIEGCKVCALGGMCLGAFNSLGIDENDFRDSWLDHSGNKQLGSFVPQKSVFDTLGDFFDKDQLSLIETAYEVEYVINGDYDEEDDELSEEQHRAIDFGVGYKDSEERFRAIMNHILKDKEGMFRP